MAMTSEVVREVVREGGSVRTTEVVVRELTKAELAENERIAIDVQSGLPPNRKSRGVVRDMVDRVRQLILDGNPNGALRLLDAHIAEEDFPGEAAKEAAKQRADVAELAATNAQANASALQSEADKARKEANAANEAKAKEKVAAGKAAADDAAAVKADAEKARVDAATAAKAKAAAEPDEQDRGPGGRFR